ncbi:hypothetical protein KXX64_009213, partial [Aspergillus fumigatus]
YLWKPTRDQRQNLPSLLVRTSSGSRPVRSADFSGCPPEVRGQKRTNAQGLNTWRQDGVRGRCDIRPETRDLELPTYTIERSRSYDRHRQRTANRRLYEVQDR